MCIIFSIYVFCGEATKKTSIDGLKWRDLVMGRWWLVNFKVSGVTKGFMCETPQGRRRHVNVHVHADNQYLRKVIQFRNNSRSIIARAARMKVTN